MLLATVIVSLKWCLQRLKFMLINDFIIMVYKILTFVSLFTIMLTFIWQSKSFLAKCFTFSAKTEKREKEGNFISEMRYRTRHAHPM